MRTGYRKTQASGLHRTARRVLARPLGKARGMPGADGPCDGMDRGQLYLGRVWSQASGIGLQGDSLSLGELTARLVCGELPGLEVTEGEDTVRLESDTLDGLEDRLSDLAASRISEGSPRLRWDAMLCAVHRLLAGQPIPEV